MEGKQSRPVIADWNTMAFVSHETQNMKKTLTTHCKPLHGFNKSDCFGVGNMLSCSHLHSVPSDQELYVGAVFK